MADPDLIEQAIKRARQLAAKMNQNAPAIKRPASELDDNIGTVKVTLAYEKPAHLDKDSHRSSHNKDNYGGNNLNNNINRDSNYSSRDRASDRDRGRDRGDRERDRGDDRDSGYSGAGSGSGGSGNSYNGNGSSPFSRNSMSMGHGILSGANAFPTGQSGEEKIELIIPHAVIGLVIGKGGENIKRIQNESGATVRVDPTTVDEHGNKVCTITGTKQAVEEAHNQVTNVIDNSGSNKRPRLQPVDGLDTYKMNIPASRTGAIIGKGGETIKSIKQQSGCEIELDKGAKESGGEESIFLIRGTPDNILKARGLMEARLASRGRDGDMHGHRDRDGRSHHGGGGGGASAKGLGTGANATPLAAYTDLSGSGGYASAATVPGQQPSSDVSAAWAAYFAQYSTMLGQTGGAPGGPTAASGLPYAASAAMMPAAPATGPVQADLGQAGAAGCSSVAAPSAASVSAPTAAALAGAAGASGQADYSDQWIEYYRANGRPDYAEQIMEYKKLAQKAQQQQL